VATVIARQSAAPTARATAARLAIAPGSGRPAVPAAGPAWFGAVMGTAMLATLLQLMAGHVHGGVLAARVLLVVAVALLIGLSTAFARRCLRVRETLRGSLTGLVPMAQWGMVSMGALAVGSAIWTVLPAWTPALAHVARSVDAVLWLAGSTLGFVLALGFAARLVRREPGEPTTIWGLAVVPPMVTATTGAALSGHADGSLRALVLLVSIAGFATALGLGAIVFGVACHHHWRVAPVPTATATSAWIPLGIVGQSVAAAQALSEQLQSVLTPESGQALAALAHGYGAVVLLLGLPLVVWAVRVTARGFRCRMAFSPGWWAMTFPVGTLVLGAHLLADQTGWWPAAVAAAFGLAALVGTWSLCAVASLRAVNGTRR
jgi:tellurite resistance protein TehA-like permease